MNETATDRDERREKPSASKRQLAKECPASFQESLRVEGLLETPEQRTGTLYHAGFEGNPLTLHQLAYNKDFQRLNEYRKAQERKVIRQIFGYHPISISREKRVWLYDADGEPIFSGRRDLKVSGIVKREKVGIILEYKTGWKPQPPAEQNLQVRANAALAHYEDVNETGIPFARIYGGILERPGIGPKFSLYEMRAPELEQELEDIERESVDALAKNPKYNVGPHCEGCAAIGICPAIERRLNQAEKLASQLKLEDKKVLKGQSLDAPGREKLKTFLKEGRLVASSYETAEKLAKALLTQDPKAFGGAPDIYLKPGNEVRIVEDLSAAYLTLKKMAQRRGQKIDADELVHTFFKVANLPISDFTDVVGRVLEIQDEEELENLVENDFNQAVRLRQNKPSLKVVI
jgi:PD-(D/E)XK nuclease superfamily